LIIITSLNPYNRTDVQLRCFQAWKGLGVQVLSANVQEEAGHLQQMGVDEADILVLPPEETGLELHGKPVPKIAAVLRHVQRLSGGDTPVALVNSDLYPAMRSDKGLGYWLSSYPAVALVREECAAPEVYRFTDRAAYRGGLDSFVFTPGALGRVLTLLEGCASVGRMCFGIPGWDYVMGALIRSSQVGGSFADSGLLLHESHATTYSDMSEFTHYLPDMHRLAGISSQDPTTAAAEFKAVIDLVCDGNAAAAALGKAMYFAAPEVAQMPDAAAWQVSEVLSAICPQLDWDAQKVGIARLAQRDIDNGYCDFVRAKALFEVNPDPQYRFSQRLLALLFCLECLTTSRADFHLTGRYPVGNLHGKVIEMAMQAFADKPHFLRLEIAQIFAAELVTHRIFNPYLYNYLVHCSQTDEERALLSQIHSHVRRFQDVA